MKKSRFTKMKTILFIICVLLCLSGCTARPVPTENSLRKIPSVAILPFENLSGEPNAGLIIMTNLNTALGNSASARIMTVDEVKQKLQGYEGQNLSAQKLGRLLGVAAVITGTVTEYRYIYGAGEQPTISINAKLVTAADGKVLWSKSYSSSGNFSWIRETTLGEVSRQICSKIASDLKSKFNR